MTKVIGIYAGIIDSGEDLPGMIAFGLEEIGGVEEWSFMVERPWVDEWLEGEIDGEEIVDRAAETYEEYEE